MLRYLITSAPTRQIDGAAELRFFEWLKHQKKTGRVTDYWALKERPGLVVIAKLNFATDLDELLEAWAERLPSEFAVEALMGHQALEAQLARRLLG